MKNLTLPIAVATTAILTTATWALVACATPPAEPAAQPTVEVVPAAKPIDLFTLPACPAEDSDNCLWDAATQGNGIGTSFIAYHGEHYYLGERRTVTLNGQVIPYVDGSDAILYCDLPLEVGIDEDDNGNQWAGCM
jgi:hypothetical protein